MTTEAPLLLSLHVSLMHTHTHTYCHSLTVCQCLLYTHTRTVLQWNPPCFHIGALLLEAGRRASSSSSSPERGDTPHLHICFGWWVQPMDRFLVCLHASSFTPISSLKDVLSMRAAGLLFLFVCAAAGGRRWTTVLICLFCCLFFVGVFFVSFPLFRLLLTTG